jgi:hypothetical protein
MAAPAAEAVLRPFDVPAESIEIDLNNYTVDEI